MPRRCRTTGLVSLQSVLQRGAKGTIMSRFAMGATIAVGIALALPIGVGTLAGSNPDTDGDGVFDLVDNCVEVFNPAPAGTNTSDMQTDTDQDGFGNHCDCDYTNNGLVNSQDFLSFCSVTARPPRILRPASRAPE